MKQETYLAILVCVPMGAVALLLAVFSVLPVRAGGGIVLRPPFDGTYRVALTTTASPIPASAVVVSGRQ